MVVYSSSQRLDLLPDDPFFGCMPPPVYYQAVPDDAISPPPYTRHDPHGPPTFETGSTSSDFDSSLTLKKAFAISLILIGATGALALLAHAFVQRYVWV
uniref:Transmembrane protein n=1 Tax=Panagrellus redivivus TaxID=6233 RepID=A0A7E4VL15_PANRE